MTRAFLALAFLALAATSSHAQLVAGSSLYFDHPATEQASVSTYRLCVDGTTTCQDIGVTRVGTTDTLTFTVPAWVPRGNRALVVVAVWKAPLTGTSAPTNTLTQPIVGGPERLRTTATVP